MVCYTGGAWFADACEVMLLSYLGPALRCAWGLPPSTESLLTSVVFAGMLAGVYSLGALSDAIGRRRGFFLSAALLGAAGLASAAAPSLPPLLALRALVGVGLGGTPTAVTLAAEFLPSHSRGWWLLAMQLWWTLGTAFEAALAWAVLGPLGWRWLLALSAAPLLILLATYPLLPESPAWLVAQGRQAEAEAVVQRVAAVNGYGRPLRLLLQQGAAQPAAAAADKATPPPSPALDSPLLPHALPSTSSYSDAEGSLHSRLSSGRPSAAVAAAAPTPAPAATVLLERSEQLGLGPPPAGTAGLETLRHGLHAASAACVACLASVHAGLGVLFGPALRRTTLLLWAIWLANAGTYYGLVLLTTALQTAAKREPCTPGGGPNLDASDYLAILVTTAAEAPGLLAAQQLIDSRGRKWTLRAGLVMCGLSLLALLAAGTGSRGLSLLLLFLARGAIEATFSVLYLFPTLARTFGLSTCNAAGRIGGFLAPFATVNLVESGRPALAELVLGSACLAGAGAAFLLPYETRGRHLESPELHDELGQEQEQVHTGAASEGGSPAVAARGERQPLLLPGARGTAGAGSGGSGSSGGHRHRRASADRLP